MSRASTSTLSGNSGALFTQLGSKLWLSFSNTTTSQRFDLSTCQQGAVGVLCDYPEGIRDPSLSVYNFAQGTSEYDTPLDSTACILALTWSQLGVPRGRVPRERYQPRTWMET